MNEPLARLPELTWLELEELRVSVSLRRQWWEWIRANSRAPATHELADERIAVDRSLETAISEAQYACERAGAQRDERALMIGVVEPPPVVPP